MGASGCETRSLSRGSPVMAFLPGNGTVVLTTGVINGHGDYSIGRRRFLNIAQKQHLQFVTAYQGRGLEESHRCVFVCAGILSMPSIQSL